MRDVLRTTWKLGIIAATVIFISAGALVASDDPISDVSFDAVPTGTTFQSGGDAVNILGDVVVDGAAEAISFQTAIGEMLVAPGVTETTALAFGERSVYIVRASWGGGSMEGTRAWFVLTHNDLNIHTGQPEIIEIGMTQGTYHHSDTLDLEQTAAVYWNQLQLSCTRSAGSDPRYCRWAVTRLSYN